MLLGHLNKQIDEQIGSGLEQGLSSEPPGRACIALGSIQCAFDSPRIVVPDKARVDVRITAERREDQNEGLHMWLCSLKHHLLLATSLDARTADCTQGRLLPHDTSPSVIAYAELAVSSHIRCSRFAETYGGGAPMSSHPCAIHNDRPDERRAPRGLTPASHEVSRPRRRGRSPAPGARGTSADRYRLGRGTCRQRGRLRRLAIRVLEIDDACSPPSDDASYVTVTLTTTVYETATPSPRPDAEACTSLAISCVGDDLKLKPGGLLATVFHKLSCVMAFPCRAVVKSQTSDELLAEMFGDLARYPPTSYNEPRLSKNVRLGTPHVGADPDARTDLRPALVGQRDMVAGGLREHVLR
jgi:hypothetical protein